MAPKTLSCSIPSCIRTPTGLLKVIELVLVFIDLMLMRFGGSGGGILQFGNTDAQFLGWGLTVGYMIILPCFLLSHLLGAHSIILELIQTFTGGILFISVGSVAMGNRVYPVGFMCVLTGITFVADSAYTYWKSDISFTSTTS